MYEDTPRMTEKLSLTFWEQLDKLTMAIPAIYAYLVAIEWTQGSYQPSVSIINNTGENRTFLQFPISRLSIPLIFNM